jgi:hypothetical protein
VPQDDKAAEKAGKTWMELRSVGNSRVVQTSVVFPLIGYLILFNDQVASFLVMRGLDMASPAHGWVAWIWARKLSAC